MFHADYFLKKHGIVLDTNKSVEEQILQMTVGFGVQDSESGDRPYIFVSYAHKDSAVVLPAIKALQDCGYPIWYDAGIRPGTTWSDYIADHVRNAALVIAFMSKNAIASQHCQSEIRYAFNNGRPMLTVRLDQSELPSGLDMQLSQWQMFTAHLYDGDAYITRLAAEPIVAETAGAALEAYNAEKRRAAEEAEHKRREAEEAERKRKEVKAAEELQRQREMVARKLREKQAELALLQEEEAELERREKTKKQEYVDPLELERKLQEAEKALRQERENRGCLEKELLNAKTRIKSLEDAAKNRDKVRLQLPKKRGEERKLFELNKKVQEHLCKQTYSDYNAAINICNNDMVSCIKSSPELVPVRQRMIDGLYAMMYHDARVLEKKNRKKAYAIYHALRWVNRDAMERKRKIEKDIKMQSEVYCIILSLFFLVANFLLVGNALDENTTLLTWLLIYAVPLLVVMTVWLIFRWGWWDKDEPLNCLEIHHLILSFIPPLIAMVVDPFLYPEADALSKLFISVFSNGLSAIIVFFGSLLVLCFEDGLRESITPIR